eukprot:g63.t1
MALQLVVKHGKSKHALDADSDMDVNEVKGILQSLTDVPASHMKLVHKGKALEAGATLGGAGLKVGKKNTLMLVGSTAKDVEAANTVPQSDAIVTDDFDLDYLPSQDDIDAYEDNMEKLAASTERTEVYFINPPRPGKRLLVLDLDHCLLHFSRSLPPERVHEMKRPLMDQFLAAAYESYDLVVWSQTSWRWVEIKLTELGMLTHPSYKICFVLDKSAMFKIALRNPKRSARHPDEFVSASVKPLQLVWAKLGEKYGAAPGFGRGAWGVHNTVQVDDLQRNFAMNPGANRCGIRCTAWSRKKGAGPADRELGGIGQYLVHIAAHVADFGTLDHSRWPEYLRRAGASGQAGAGAGAAGASGGGAAAAPPPLAPAAATVTAAAAAVVAAAAAAAPRSEPPPGDSGDGDSDSREHK